ncbi:MAG: hypothetical protein RIK87_25605 [Fuerstiella sp.]
MTDSLKQIFCPMYGSQIISGFVITTAALLCAAVVTTSSADDDKPDQKAVESRGAGQTKKSGSNNRQLSGKLTSDQEDRALEFAKANHPELAELLTRLRAESPTGFARGIREVHLASQRLERFRDKHPARFEAELKSWKMDSEIRLLAAKWAMSQDPELERQIRGLLVARQQMRLDRLKLERKKLAERLSQLDRQIGMGNAELEADVVSEWERLTKQASAAANARRRDVRKEASGSSARNVKAKAKTNTKSKSGSGS